MRSCHTGSPTAVSADRMRRVSAGDGHGHERHYRMAGTARAAIRLRHGQLEPVPASPGAMGGHQGVCAGQPRHDGRCGWQRHR